MLFVYRYILYSYKQKSRVDSKYEQRSLTNTSRNLVSKIRYETRHSSISFRRVKLFKIRKWAVLRWHGNQGKLLFRNSVYPIIDVEKHQMFTSLRIFLNRVLQVTL